jgi:hypothetical protein
MERNGNTTLMSLCMDLESAGAHEAYQIFAKEIPSLSGMFVIQYAPYEAGDGNVFWVKNPAGTEIPVITCKYALWAGLKNPRAGTPAKIARLINKDAAKAKEDSPLLAWTIVHTWSGFVKDDDSDSGINTNKLPLEDIRKAVTPSKWCVEELDRNVRVVSPDELVWRIRRLHDKQTK